MSCSQIRHSGTTVPRWPFRILFSRLGRVAIGLSVVSSMACSGLLSVSDPTLIRDSDIANASGANARRLDVLAYLNNNVSVLTEDVSRITDELVADVPSEWNAPDYLDQRDGAGDIAYQGASFYHLGDWDQIFYQTSIAIPAVRAYSPDSVKGEYLGELYGVRGYAILQIAEDICSGFPLNDVSADNRPLFSGPLTTDSAFALANMQLDSAIKYAHDSVRFVTLARVVKGRALLDLGQFAAAAQVVAPVATSSVFQTDGPELSIYYDMIGNDWSQGGFNYAVGERDGANGLPFVSANDPRVPTVLGGTRADFPDDTLYRTTKYPSSSSHMVLASGIEARLIEAEAALHAGDPNWIDILNTIRAAAITPALPPLTAPETTAEQIDLLYRERAFWLYLTGRRLGDMRRLIRNYGRSSETVFPTGPYPLGGVYGSATSIPFNATGEQMSNPNIIMGCTTP